MIVVCKTDSYMDTKLTVTIKSFLGEALREDFKVVKQASCHVM